MAVYASACVAPANQRRRKGPVAGWLRKRGGGAAIRRKKRNVRVTSYICTKSSRCQLCALRRADDLCSEFRLCWPSCLPTLPTSYYHQFPISERKMVYLHGQSHLRLRVSRHSPIRRLVHSRPKPRTGSGTTACPCSSNKPRRGF